jgi:hypothetical protein
MSAAYEEGYDRMRAALMDKRPSTDEAFGMLAELRVVRDGQAPGSPEWMGAIGETTALLHAFPHLFAADDRGRAKLRLVDFSPTEPGGLSEPGEE